MVIRDQKKTQWTAQRKGGVREVAEHRSYVVFAVEEMTVEAFLDLQEFRIRLKMHFDASNAMVQTLQVLLVHKHVVDRRREDQTDVADAPHKMAQSLAGGTRQRTVADSMMVGKHCDHKVMQYSVRREAAAAAVLDPCCLMMS